MRVAAIIAVRNTETYIGVAIDSVLGQSQPPAQVIVVNDGSDDATPRILAGFGDRIVVLNQGNRGQAAALNRAVAHTRCDLIAFNDADDLWCANKLKLQAAALRADARLEAVFGHVLQFVSPGDASSIRTSSESAADSLRGEFKQCMLIRRQALYRVGLFDEGLPATFFIEWLGRAKRAGLTSVTLDEVVVLRRIHAGNGGRLNKTSQDDETLQALWKNINGRRDRRL